MTAEAKEMAFLARALPPLDAAGEARRVPEDLVRRHLGLPPEAPADAATAGLLEEARAWYLDHGDPWARASLREVASVEDGTVRLEGGAVLEAPPLAADLRASGARVLVAAGFSAGPAADAEIERLWKEDLPDRSLALHAYAVGVVEHLRARTAELLRLHFAGAARVLPYRSPGYPGWPLEGQAPLLSLLDETGPLRILPSGGLLPQRSALAAHAVAPANGSNGARPPAAARGPAGAAAPAPARQSPFPARALEKWSRERLRLSRQGERLEAVFRFDGTTCSSLGRPLAFDYRVTLAPGGGGRLEVAACSCEPAPGAEGHRSMCAWRDDPRAMEAAIAVPPPVIGLDVEEAVAWSPAVSSTGCLCRTEDRHHKWKLVLETLRFALGRTGALRAEAGSGPGTGSGPGPGTDSHGRGATG